MFVRGTYATERKTDLISRKNGRPTFRLSFNYSGLGGFDPACREMSELMIEQPDGTLSPCTGANAPSSALSVELDERTRAALDASVMDGLFSAFDAQDPLNELTQVADAGTVMSDGEEETNLQGGRIYRITWEIQTFMDKPFESKIALSNGSEPFINIASAVDSAAHEVRDLARSYYTNYDDIHRDTILPEVGVQIFQHEKGEFTYKDAIVGSASLKKEDGVVFQDGTTPFPAMEPKGMVARMHFHWSGDIPTRDDIRNAFHVARNVGPEYEAWIATYDGISRYFPWKQR